MRGALAGLLAVAAAGCVPADRRPKGDVDTGGPGVSCAPVATLDSAPEQCIEDLQDGVEQAILGDTLHLLAAAAGPAHLVISADLTVEGEGVALQGTGEGAVVTVLGGEVVLRGLRLSGGTGDTDPGFDEGNATIGGCLNGLRAAALTVEDTLVEGCTADWGGGIMGPVDGALVLRASTVRANTATALGGGVWVRQGALEGVQIEGNSAPYAGGLAVRADPATATAVTLTDVELRSNSARVKGGGLHIGGGAAVQSTGLVVEGNTAQQGAGGHIYQSTAGLSGGRICENTALVGGGGLLVEEGQPVLDGLELCANLVTGEGLPGEEGVGGGLWTVDAAATIENTLVVDNTAGWGAGLMLAGSTEPPATVQLQAVTVASNGPAGEQRGAGIAVEAAALVGSGLVIEDNRGAAAGGLLFGSGTATVEADWSDNTPADVAETEGAEIAAVPAGSTVHCDAAGCAASAP
jgi:hypothetical protein